MHNMQQDGKTVVKLEIWVDPNNINNWQKVYDFIDSGGLGSDGRKCGGAPDQRECTPPNWVACQDIVYPSNYYLHLS